VGSERTQIAAKAHKERINCSAEGDVCAIITRRTHQE
jgi:hypothetical protein